MERLEITAKEKLYNYLLTNNYALGIVGDSVSISIPNTNRKVRAQKCLGRLDFRETEGNATFQIYSQRHFSRARQIKKTIKQFGVSMTIFVEVV